MMRELICIRCPRGCHLKVDAKNKNVIGNWCGKGEEYGLSEVTNPVRIVTSTIKVINGEFNVIPVKTSKAINKDFIFKCMDEINKTTVKAPIKIGDILIKNVLNTGTDIIATRNVFEK